MMERAIIEQVVAKVLASMTEQADAKQTEIPVGISNRHIHLSAEHTAMLLGSGHE